MLKKYLNELRQYKTLLIALLLLGVIGFLGAYSFKKIRSCINDYKFEKALEQAGKIDPNSWDEKYKNTPIKDKYKVVIISNGGGEYSYAEYFKYAAEKMGWEVEIFYGQLLGHEKEVLQFDPDFIMFTAHINSDIAVEIMGHRSKKYTLELSPLEMLASNGGILNKASRGFAKFNELLYTSNAVLTAAKEVGFYQNIFKKMNKNFNGLRVLPLTPGVKNEPAESKSITWMGGGNDKLRSSKNYKQFIELISQNIPMKIYGRYKFSSFTKPGSYDGFIPSAKDMIKAIRENGIYLLTHSDFHIKAATPTLRIFEAVSANVIVISDKHPFAVEHFGDNFLYFDHNASAQEMYKQVKAHYDWIKANPKEAKAMANRAHQIFLEKFTLEKDLIRIAKMHEYIVEQEKKLHLGYPIVY
jgi:hypothetical protein